MFSTRLQSRQLRLSSENPLWKVQSFVKLNTLRNMSLVARKMAMVRQAVQEINRVEGLLLRTGANNKEFIVAMGDMAEAAIQGSGWTKEAIAVLNGVKRDVEQYLRDVKNASN